MPNARQYTRDTTIEAVPDRRPFTSRRRLKISMMHAAYSSTAATPRSPTRVVLLLTQPGRCHRQAIQRSPRPLLNVAETGVGPLILDGELSPGICPRNPGHSHSPFSPRIGRKRVTNDVRRSTPVRLHGLSIFSLQTVSFCWNNLFVNAATVSKPLRKLLPVTVSTAGDRCSYNKEVSSIICQMSSQIPHRPRRQRTASNASILRQPVSCKFRR